MIKYQTGDKLICIKSPPIEFIQRLIQVGHKDARLWNVGEVTTIETYNKAEIITRIIVPGTSGKGGWWVQDDSGKINSELFEYFEDLRAYEFRIKLNTLVDST